MTRLAVKVGGRSYQVELGAGGEITVDGRPLEPGALQPAGGGAWRIWAGGRWHAVEIDPDLRWARFAGERASAYPLEIRQEPEVRPRSPCRGGRVCAPIPGTIRQVQAIPGQEVCAGDLLVVLEAMKMENHITAPQTGRVAAVHVREGQAVGKGEPLVEIEASGKDQS